MVPKREANGRGYKGSRRAVRRSSTSSIEVLGRGGGEDQAAARGGEHALSRPSTPSWGGAGRADHRGSPGVLKDAVTTPAGCHRRDQQGRGRRSFASPEIQSGNEGDAAGEGVDPRPDGLQRSPAEHPLDLRRRRRGKSIGGLAYGGRGGAVRRGSGAIASGSLSTCPVKIATSRSPGPVTPAGMSCRTPATLAPLAGSHPTPEASTTAFASRISSSLTAVAAPLVRANRGDAARS